MREHALPQDVTSYRFHIIGNMTLKQFAEVAGGVAIGFLIYLTNLPVILKWPFILIAAGAGAMAAFVPIEERPLDQWILSLLRALYRPTQFYWKRTTKLPEPFLFEPKTDTHRIVREVDLTPARRQRVREYLHSIENTEQRDVIDEYSSQRLNEVISIFENPAHTNMVTNLQTISNDVSVNTEPQIPAEQISEAAVQSWLPTEQLPEVSVAQKSNFSAVTPQTTTIKLPAENIPTVEVKSATQQQTQAVPTYFSVDSVTNAFVPQTVFGDDTPAIPTHTDTYTSVNVPTTGSVVVDHAVAETAEKQEFSTPNLADANHTYVEASIPTGQTIQATQAVVQNIQLPFPAKPTEANKIVGMVIDQSNNPLQNAIVEILTPDGLPARAVKTNMLGQFFITTPLNNGTYTLTAEKEGFQFTPQQLTLSGKIVDPIEVRSN